MSNVSNEAPVPNEVSAPSRSNTISRAFARFHLKVAAPQNADIIIAVMGVTGAGKSTFIRTVTGQNVVEVGHNLESETSEVKAYRFSYGSINYVLVDTPGFDDSRMCNEELRSKIVRWLVLSYHSGIRLNGIIYIHSIAKPRIQGSAYQNMRFFRQLCGNDALGNVILATSFWDLVSPSVGAEREKILKEEFWANMITRGSKVVRLKRDRAACLEVLGRIASSNQVDLLIQQEIVTQDKNVKDTTVGQNTASREVQKFQMTMEKDTNAQKKWFQGRLNEGQRAHKEEMEKLRESQKRAQRQTQQDQRRAEKEHKRNVRDDRKQMRQERRDLEASVRRADPPAPVSLNSIMGCLYGLACFWTLLITALLGDVISDASGGTPADINFCMFVTVVSWICSICGVLLWAIGSEFMSRKLLIMDVIAVLCIFLAAVILSAKLGVHSCSNHDYTSTNDTISGSLNLKKSCQELQACAAFFWFLFFIYLVEIGGKC